VESTIRYTVAGSLQDYRNIAESATLQYRLQVFISIFLQSISHVLAHE